MELHIAGGCGEHGRNCFHVMGEHTDFLVDCGLMAAEQDGYPRLPLKEIPNIRTVFLTHSHADHTGALPWLCENGFRGEIIASGNTLEQLPVCLKNTIPIESICESGQEGYHNGIRIRWGKSGHCLGSVWYRFETEGKLILFSGDYSESSLVYAVDPIRGQEADIAVLDCAYCRDETTGEDACKKLLNTVRELLRRHGAVVLPVPKYGRGLDLLALFVRNGLKARYWGDSHFQAQLQGMKEIPEWFCADSGRLVKAVQEQCNCEASVWFVSDPQLRSERSAQMVTGILQSGGAALMTGTVEDGTNSARLIQEGRMLYCRFPVHLNFLQYQRLAKQNHFGTVIPYHSAEMVCEREMYVF